MQYVIALGANLGDKSRTFALAIKQMEQGIGPLLRQSSWHVTEPILHPDYPTHDQPLFLNGVVVVESSLEPVDVLTQLLEIETRAGRNRTEEIVPWAPRVLDLDLIAAGQTVIDTPELAVPHPRMQHRLFVLAPMCEVVPDWVHPVLKRTALELLSDCNPSRP